MLIACGVVSLAGAQVGPCAIGYVVEEVAIPAGVLNWAVSDDGVVFIDTRLFKPGVGEIASPPHFYPLAMSASGLLAGFPIPDGSVTSLYSLVSLATVDGDITTYDFTDLGVGFEIYGISDSGWIAGAVKLYPEYDDSIAARITPTGELEILQSSSGERSYALVINESGQVAGMFLEEGSAAPSSFFWDVDGSYYELPIPSDRGPNEPSGINDAGEVVIVTVGAPPSRWSVQNGMVPISTWGGDSGFVAWGMNDLGHVVGTAGFQSAWVYMNGQYSFLNSSLIDSPGWNLYSAYASNDRGQILGTGALNGEFSCYLATPRGLCGADMTTTGAPAGQLGDGVPDGEITGTDLSFFVNGWLVGDSIADVTSQNAPLGDPQYGQPDGLITGADIQYYVNMWVSGCGA